MQLGTFTANIIVDGKALEEYDVTSESPSRVTCWVASEEGKPFTVQWKCLEETRVAGSRGSVYVDGTGCGSVLKYPGTLGDKDTTATLSSLVRATSMQDLMFARRWFERTTIAADVIPFNNEELHERSKKQQFTVLGKYRIWTAKGQETLSIYLSFDPQQSTRNQFVFKYRPLGVLQANGIAPRPASADIDAGLENNDDERNVEAPNGSVPEDIKPAQLNGRIRNLENELKRLRDLQASDSEDRKPKRIKTESREGRRPLIVPGEIIDLT
ncbi:hypothetical protein JVT61DRAFT_4471 [Boletus reticuloceps]|uniref:DUF7918 domain-containing protein n=1 Tax=Boletus reticuloceps TaxID=495285 RepID=A0A8I2YL33_9AGAM|nr:hypothetical protein JVT61DRAFT_4471 [Boletus reticuloceps]